MTETKASLLDRCALICESIQTSKKFLDEAAGFIWGGVDAGAHGASPQPGNIDGWLSEIEMTVGEIGTTLQNLLGVLRPSQCPPQSPAPQGYNTIARGAR